MRIASIEAIPLRLPFREEFRIARGSVGGPGAGAPHVYVRVVAHNGLEGWGEARPSHRWSYETEESVLSTIRNYLAPALLDADPYDLQRLHAVMDREIAPGISTGAPIAKCGVDMAVHDLLARAAGISLTRFLGGGGESCVRLSYLISASEPEAAAGKAAEAVAAGYGALKVKIGVEPRRDIEILRAIREAAPDVYLWADANQAYDAATAVVLARRLAGMVDCLEQPVPANDWLGLQRLTRVAALPIAADESVFSPSDLVQLVRLDACDLLVVKLSKMAGVHRAALAIRIAREAGIGVLGSGLTETGLGLAATVHVLSACGGCLYADLNGPQFLADDPVADGVTTDGGVAAVRDAPGIGVTLDPEKLTRYRVQ